MSARTLVVALMAFLCGTSVAHAQTYPVYSSWGLGTPPIPCAIFPGANPVLLIKGQWGNLYPLMWYVVGGPCPGWGPVFFNQTCRPARPGFPPPAPEFASVEVDNGPNGCLQTD